MNLDQERADFETLALQLHKAKRAACDPATDDTPDLEPTAESLFWRTDDGMYGVKQFNAAWWAWRMRAEVAHSVESNLVNALRQEVEAPTFMGEPVGFAPRSTVMMTADESGPSDLDIDPSKNPHDPTYRGPTDDELGFAAFAADWIERWPPGTAVPAWELCVGKQRWVAVGKAVRDACKKNSVLSFQMDMTTGPLWIRHNGAVMPLNDEAKALAVKCTECDGRGSICVGRSGLADDGNAPEFDVCEGCFGSGVLKP